MFNIAYVGYFSIECTPLDCRGGAGGKIGGKGARLLEIKGGLISRGGLAFSSITWGANIVQPIFVYVGLCCMTFSKIFACGGPILPLLLL